MALLNFNVYGHRFETGLEILRSSYLEARDALLGGIERAQDEAIGYQQAVEQNPQEAEIETDDAGFILYDRQDVLNWNVMTAEAAAMALRKAYVIATYHHWERSAREWTKSANGKHDKLVALTIGEGYPIHPRLASVRDLVNLLKHANKVWGLKLAESWPEALYPDIQPLPLFDWYESVNLTEVRMDEIFTAIRESGPSATTTKSPAG